MDICSLSIPWPFIKKGEGGKKNEPIISILRFTPGISGLKILHLMGDY